VCLCDKNYTCVYVTLVLLDSSLWQRDFSNLTRLPFWYQPPPLHLSSISELVFSNSNTKICSLPDTAWATVGIPSNIHGMNDLTQWKLSLEAIPTKVEAEMGVGQEWKERASKDIVKEQKKFRLKCLSSEDQNIGNVYLVIRLGSGGTLLWEMKNSWKLVPSLWEHRTSFTKVCMAPHRLSDVVLMSQHKTAMLSHPPC
jgi:hypothetical protein